MKDTGIPWADSTMNPWHGCHKISPACKHCYAATVDERFSSGDHWGEGAPRRFFGEKHWNEPLKWQRAVERGAVGKDGKRWYVFCASMADVLEDRRDLDPWRTKLWGLVNLTPGLTWLMLTKRPENLPRLVPDEMREAANVWWGATVESEDYLWRADALCEHAPRAPVRFLSMEPLLGPVDISSQLDPCGSSCGESSATIDWVIVGSESGETPRAMDVGSVRSIRRACQEFGVPFFLKQADDDGTHGISASPPPGELLPERNAPYRRRDLRQGPDGVKRAHYIIERPYLDGEQSVRWPA